MKPTIILQDQVYDSAATVVEKLGIRPLTLTRWTKKGKLPQPVKLGQRLYYNRRAVEDTLLYTAKR
jgi:predicted site-specific integrase-resolvase